MTSYKPPTAKNHRVVQSTLISGLGLLLTTLVLRTADATGTGAPFGEEALATVATPQNPILQVGILQRLGRSDTDQVELAAPAGSLLTLQFEQADGSLQTQRTAQVTIGIVNRALTTPETIHRLILSSHKSFESAEANANHWQSLGISTEIAQPEEWQVWAHRAYTPQQLTQIQLYAQEEGIPNVRAVVQEQRERAELSWVHEHFRYHRTRLTVTSDAGYLRVNDRYYAGSLTIQPNAYGSYTVVNAVPLETYLRGVVPHEVGPGAPFAAMAAQAILARTYALKNLHRFEIDDYQICANTHCQVYRGLTGTNPRTDEAIRQTSGQVLTYNGELVDAVYSSTNGGVSAAFEDVWDGDPRPYLRPQADIAHQPGKSLDLRQESSFQSFLAQREGFNEVGVSRLFRWEFSQSLNELNAQLRAAQDYLGIPMPRWTSIQGMNILERSASGRVQAMQLDLQTAAGPHSITLHKDQVRLAFPRLYSTMFRLEPLKQADQLAGYQFIGGGFGHGVGLSQYGSYTLARQGFSPAQILDFYYPGTTLAPLGSLSLELPDASIAHSGN
ncbi:SpoIID/LytB domain-containing protein [Synechococcus sp. Nb3U1]|uniref:SpoIID/LytB domain-containing protein n=1 Tax=Synechococcus sp. Nb3U1 TaxID=1914529 RepID=UPI001F38B712|nr:SpoIID/LytB domain-containing protein [Synechococcus sp. Nb3U1]MCF2970911.1 SpoIID/LytB domain-containing protein [Synechococcus sp. Nb3U1]